MPEETTVVQPHIRIPHEFFQHPYRKKAGFAWQLYETLLSHANHETGIAFPSQSRLADELDSSVAAVRRMLRKLKKVKWIKVKDGTGIGVKNAVYEVVTPMEIMAMSPVRSEQSSQVKRLQKRSLSPVTSDHPVPSEVNPITSTKEEVPITSTMEEKSTPDIQAMSVPKPKREKTYRFNEGDKERATRLLDMIVSANGILKVPEDDLPRQWNAMHLLRNRGAPKYKEFPAIGRPITDGELDTVLVWLRDTKNGQWWWRENTNLQNVVSFHDKFAGFLVRAKADGPKQPPARSLADLKLAGRA
jgi:DNA-binding transcriptional regulator YhcF (GntR family)